MTSSPTSRAVRLLATLVTGGALLLGACSSSAPSATTSASALPPVASAATTSDTDPCHLVSAQDAQAAIGGPVSDPKPRTSPGGARSCTYTETPAAVDSGLVTVTVFGADVSYALVQDQYTNEHLLSGVGDEGFLSFMDGTAGGNAGFRVGSTVVVISLGAKGDTTAIPGKLRILAVTAAGRL